MDATTATAFAQMNQAIQDLTAQMQQMQLSQAQATPAPGDPGNAGPVAAPTSGGRLNVDARQLNKPDVFHGEDKKWRDWEIVFRSYAVLANPELETLLRHAESLKDPIEMGTLTPKEKLAGRELYHILISMVRGQALDKVVNAGEFNGLEAWRLATYRSIRSKAEESDGRSVGDVIAVELRR